MVFKNFKINTIVRVLVLSLSIFIFVLFLENEKFYIMPFVLGILIVLQVVLLIYYVDRTNIQLTNFLNAIKFSDFSTSFKIEGLGTSFDNLKDSFNQVINEFVKIRSEKEEHFYYLQNIVEHIEVGILVFYSDGKVKLINKAAKNLFEINRIENISEIANWNEEMQKTLMTINPNEDSLIKIVAEDDILQLAIHADEFKIQDRNVKLVSIKNIKTELDAKEMDAWQKLIRVLTHEIMNSIAPISSLTATVNQMVEEVEKSTREFLPQNYDFEQINDIKEALTTIQKRSSGLIHFVETYRNLTKIPKPSFSVFHLKQQLEYIKSLFDREFQQKNILFEITVVPDNLKILADEQLVEQVLINLVKNAIYALENRESPSIKMKAFIDNKGRKLIQVFDNGQGILPDVIEKIFIPFFTTKQKGSGIGLSLSRQIMRLHNGAISVYSEPEKGTIFTLSF